MLPSDHLKPRNSHDGSVDNPIQPHTQPSVPNVYGTVCTSINNGSTTNDSGKGTSPRSLPSLSSLSSSPSSLSLYRLSYGSSPSFSGSSSESLAPHAKRQRLQGLSDTAAAADCGSMCDKDTTTTPQQTIMGGATITQSMMQTMLDKAIGPLVEKIVNLESMMQEMHGNHTHTTNDVVGTRNTSTSTSTSTPSSSSTSTSTSSSSSSSSSSSTTTKKKTTKKKTKAIGTTTTEIITTEETTAQDMSDGSVSSNSSIIINTNTNADAHAVVPTDTMTTADADAATIHTATASSTYINDTHDNSRIDAIPLPLPPPPSPPVVFHDGTRQFTIPPLPFPSIIKPPIEFYQPRPEMDVEDQHKIVPSMILCILANDPAILLPLASCKTFLFDPIHAVNNESFRTLCTPIDYFCDIVNAVTSVVCNRLLEALHVLFPNACVYEDSKFEEHKVMANELEKGPRKLLESIVRDAMAVVNPIRVLITYLEAVTTHYAKLTLTAPGEMNDFREFIARQMWVQDLAHLSIVYGLYLWDSQWVSDDEWERLTEYMSILTSDIFPEAYLRLFPTPNDGDDTAPSFTPYEFNVIRYFKHILACIACCFLHHYRPIKKPISIPYSYALENGDIHGFWISPPVYQTGLASSIALLKQCAAEYMDHPEDFLDFSPIGNLLNFTATVKGYKSPRDYTLSEIGRSCKRYGTYVSPKPKNQKNETKVFWRSIAPVYNGCHRLSPLFLADRIIHNPPLGDAVYTKIASIFPKEAHRTTLTHRYANPSDDPQFQLKPANRIRDTN